MNETASTVKAPVHLWVVGGLSLAWNAFGVYDFIMTTTQGEAYWKASGMTEPMIAYYLGMPNWMYGPWVIGVWGALFGSIFLLARKAWAVPAFAASLLGAVVSLLYGLVKPMPDVPPELAAMKYMSYLIVLIAGLLYWYAAKQKKSGVLR